MRNQCELLDLTRSNLYYKGKTSLSESDLCNDIYDTYLKYPYYGYRKITAHLRYQGVMINHKRVQRLMQIMGLRSVYPGPKTSRKGAYESVYPYLLKGLVISQPNQVWSVDITYIRLPPGMVYLFALIDWFSRFIVGWTLAPAMTVDYALNTLDAALKLATPDICNADQGSQFTSLPWIEALKTANIRISHDGPGRCIDNVRIERFWRTIKYEDVHLKHYLSVKDAKQGIAAFIHHYNFSRPHQALDYQRPFELFYQNLSTLS